jgi:hypothetical protein
MSPSDSGPLALHQAMADPISEACEPSTSICIADEKGKKKLERGPSDMTSSMQEMMYRMGRDLDALRDTIHYMQGAQDAQNNIIRRLSIWQRRT